MNGSIERTADHKHSGHTAALITLVVAALTALGLVLVYSSTSVGIAAQARDATLFLRKQFLWAVLGVGVFVLARTTPLNTLRRWSLPLMGVTVLMLLVVLIPGLGRKVNGARRWLQFGALRGQPSELAKLALVIFTAAWASSRGEQLRELKGLLPGLGVIAFVSGLVAVEPDMGTGLLLFTTGTLLLVVAGARIRHLALVGAPCLLAVGLFAFTRLGYVRRRIEAFLDPSGDPSGVGYQMHQALIALGSGGLFGRGLGASQQKLLFLPDVHTDFIFALVGEELGLLGGLGVLLGFMALVVYGMQAVDRARDRFAFLLGTGLVLILGMQSMLNIAVATGSVPPKGIALPFVSFGGSSLLAMAAVAGLLARVAAEGREPAPLLARNETDEEDEQDGLL